MNVGGMSDVSHDVFAQCLFFYWAQVPGVIDLTQLRVECIELHAIAAQTAVNLSQIAQVDVATMLVEKGLFVAAQWLPGGRIAIAAAPSIDGAIQIQSDLGAVRMLDRSFSGWFDVGFFAGGSSAFNGAICFDNVGASRRNTVDSLL